jgi:hypothetical protein
MFQKVLRRHSQSLMHINSNDMKKYLTLAIIFALAIIPCILTKGLILAITCGVMSMVMLLICTYIEANSEE